MHSDTATHPIRQRQLDYLAGARNAAEGRPIANNTRLVWHGDDPAIRLHATDVAVYTPDGIRLDTGGWYTDTTKDRMSMALGHAGWYLHTLDERHYGVPRKWYAVHTSAFDLSDELAGSAPYAETPEQRSAGTPERKAYLAERRAWRTRYRAAWRSLVADGCLVLPFRDDMLVPYTPADTR